MQSPSQYPSSFIRKSRKSAPELFKTRGVTLEAFPISGTVVPDHPEFSEHWHRFVEIGIIIGGTGLHVINGRDVPIHSGHVFVLPPELKHAYRETEGLHLINICYDPARLQLDEKELDDLPGYNALFHFEPRLRSYGELEHMLKLEPAELCRIESLALKIVHESRKQPKGYRMMARAFVFQLIAELSRLFDKPYSAPNALVQRLAGAIKHLESHSQEEIDFDKLPQAFHFSKRSFYRLFSAATGQSPLAYLRIYRLQQAYRLLQESGKSVTEIAYEVGFQNSSHFSRRFQELFGHPPSHFQNQKLAIRGR